MQTEDTVIDQIQPIENVYVRASAGKRFLNYLIDVIAFYIVVFGTFVLIAINSPASVDDLTDGGPGSELIGRVLALIGYAFFMSIVEAVTNGKSLGKLITGTRAINLDGSNISASTAFGRGFSRAVPFCVFSAFGTPCDPWQDRWTDTMVIDQKQSKIDY
jgi:uncharacterized RDD family membrane protein YckC